MRNLGVYVFVLLGYSWSVYALLGEEIGKRKVAWIVVGTFVMLTAYRKGTKLFIKAFLSLCAVSVCSLLIFSFFEVFPGLIPVFYLDYIPYYEGKLAYIADPILRKRNRPLLSRVVTNFRGSNYSPSYGVDVKPTIIEWSTDKDGFRNSRNIDRADIAFIGDSMLDAGDNDADTVPKRLGRLTGLTARNLGASAYGPDQYLEVLKKYGVRLSPKYALFAFDEGNDIGDIVEFERWKNDDPEKHIPDSLSKSFWRRYTGAINSIFVTIEDWIFTRVLRAYRVIEGPSRQIHPDIAVLNISGRRFQKLFLSSFSSKWDRTSEETLNTHEWQRLRQILNEFKNICASHDITPMVIYIPSDVNIYAEYSTPESGENWRKYRAQQVALKGTVERPVKKLTQELGIEFISLTPSFEAAAKQGRMLYYTLDSHWNSEGRAIAAEYLAEALKKTREYPRRQG